MNKENMKKVLKFLEKLPEKHFNLEIVTNIVASANPHMRIQNMQKIGTTFKERKCGAMGCVIGWMPIIFPERAKWNEWGAVLFVGIFLDSE